MSMKKVALITGGSRGIGLGIARRLILKDFNLAINGVRDPAQVEGVLADLRRLGPEVNYYQGNIGHAKDRMNIFDRIKDEMGRIDILVNNAGIAPKERNDILETSEESFDHVMGVNLRGTFFLTQLVAKMMIAQKKEDAQIFNCIINVTSISATIVSVNRAEYCISKAGTGMVTALFAARLGEFDIPVYEIRPGIIRTDMTAGVKEKYDKLLENDLCVQSRWGEPDDVGKVIASLAEGSFPYSTGQVIMVDGGLSLSRL
jgi:NAD(P)-dependent dehydrogenase (short-subunit alcohol dehydrogenase family)